MLNFPLMALIEVSQMRLVGVLVAAVLLILLLVMKLRVQAFVALLLASVFVGVASGTMGITEVGEAMVRGAGKEIGFIALIIGLGSIFGAFIEHSGGAQSLANGLLARFGEKRATWAMMLTGFLISIPVFLDVAIVILAPIVYTLARRSGKSLLYYGLPLGAGLAVTHAFVPPTPGPTWVAYALNVPLSQAILYGLLVGLPVAVLTGPLFSVWLAKRVYVAPPPLVAGEEKGQLPPFGLIACVLLLPVVMIFAGALVEQSVAGSLPAGMERAELTAAKAELLAVAPWWQQTVSFLGHPVVALLVCAMVAMYVLGTMRGVGRDDLMDIATKSLSPAGVIILITGAGGVFKQMLIETRVGEALAETLVSLGAAPLFMAWLFSTIIRVAQGSATVAMVASAALMGPILALTEISTGQTALIVVAIAAGATGFSHVNDSGFWVVGRYFCMTEKQTLQTWFWVGTSISVLSLVFCGLLWFLV
ncbi:gluconate transporter [Phragmitibacter flavus]|uniref:Gluconate transporter n=1 Tax=Phragmitibacter flavus TaxID=2576071 RepID=A0A5R8KDJ2_9BACT|nr:gluconate:H+ symporter [Phragmitibacter flavus]TLD70376.1 gluconate transporter [Phragmitibacter flavus]